MRLSSYFDRIAITLSALCIVHCVAIPILIAVLPLAALSVDGTEHFHELMLWLIVPVSIVGLALGHRIHAEARIVGIGLGGVIVLAVAALFGHGVWPETIEVLITVAGSLTLATGHWLNYRAVRCLHRHH